MQKILAIVAVLALLVLGGVTGAGFPTGHGYSSDQITADDSGPGG